MGGASQTIQKEKDMPSNASDQNDPVSRRSFLGAAAAAISSGAIIAPLVLTHSSMAQSSKDRVTSNPGPINQPIADENSSSEVPPASDRGDVPSFWYSFDLAHRRLHSGGWSRQVTERDLPISRDVAGVNMRLTAGGYRELHWHTANEWAYMITGTARVTCLNPDGTVFIGDVGEGDLWYFPAGFPHSIQGLGPDGCEFLLVFDEGGFSEYATFLLSEWVAHMPKEVLAKNFNLTEASIAKLPKEEEFIFQGTVPGSLEDDKRAVGGPAVESKIDFTFRMKSMKPTIETQGGEARVVDSSVFPVSKGIAAGLVRVKAGGIRELHWHPNASEWQYYITGNARMTVFISAATARTMNFKTNDVGFVPSNAAHYVENTGTEDLVFLEIFKSSYFSDFSLNQWMRRLPVQMVHEHLHLDTAEIERIPDRKNEVIGT
jgi:oxalate decarboxylase